MKKIISKENVVYFTLAIICSFIIFIPWLFKVHYTIDDYTIGYYGYQYYATKWSLNDGRVVMYLLIMIASIFNTPIDGFIIINELIGIIISCISVVFLIYTIYQHKTMKDIKSKILIFLICYFTIFNFMFIDCMYYIECSVMALSILCYMIAAKVLVENKKHSFMKSFLILLIAFFSYQGTLCVFFTFMFLLSSINSGIKSKVLFKNFGKCCILSILTLSINMGFVHIVGKIMNLQQTRLSGFQKFYQNIDYIIKKTSDILIRSCNQYPSGLFLVLLTFLSIIFFVAAYQNKDDNKKLIRYVILILIGIASTSIFFVVTKSSFECGRMRITIGSLIGYIFIYIYLLTNIFEKKTWHQYACIFILLIYIMNTIYSYEKIMVEQLKVNMLEKEEASQIVDYIQHYEETTGNKVSYLVEVKSFHQYNKSFYPAIKTHIPSMNASGLRHYDKTYSTISFYTTKRLKLVNKAVDTHLFSEQYLEYAYECIGDTLYIAIYKV